MVPALGRKGGNEQRRQKTRCNQLQRLLTYSLAQSSLSMYSYTVIAAVVLPHCREVNTTARDCITLSAVVVARLASSSARKHKPTSCMPELTPLDRALSFRRMASGERGEQLRILLIPFFTTSHIGPHADFAIRLAAARPGAVEPTIAVIPANVSIVRAALERHGRPEESSVVKVATYPFPDVDGLPRGVENLSAAGVDAWRIDAAAADETLTRPAQEALVRERSPDAIVTDIHFSWNSVIAGELGVPCVSFGVIGPFSALAMRHIAGAVTFSGGSDWQEVIVPGFPGPEIRIPRTELPEFLRRRQRQEPSQSGLSLTWMDSCFGRVVNTFLDMERPYCELYARNGYAKRAYFVGPLSLPLPPTTGASAGESPPCISWLDSKPRCSVVYVCFGTYASVSWDQLRELALGLEASEKPFLWVLRADDGWAPPEGWEERVVGKRGMVVREWAPQTAILSHPAVGAFLTHCGSSSLLEAAAAGVPMLTWPLVFDQFIEERLVTEVLKVGERAWDGSRSTRYEEKEVVPAEAVARAVTRFLEPGGAAEEARVRARQLAAKAHAAVAEGGSSHRDLRRLIDDLIEARAARAGGTVPSSRP